MNFELNKKNIVLLTIFVLVIIIGLTLHDYRNPTSVNKNNEKISLVTDYSRFFTISNASSKYINYLKNQDQENLMLLLSDSYISVNNINKNNVLSKLTLLDNGEYSFEARMMYQENISKNIIRYYLKGYLTKIIMDEYQRPTDYYLIIDLDLDNLTFAVTPYDKKSFEEVK